MINEKKVNGISVNDGLKKKIRVGIIGAGNWANYGHIPSMNLSPDYEILAVQSRRKEAAEMVAAKNGIRYVVDTVQELATHPEVDMVVVLTTAPQHEAGVRAAIAAGKDVYCEWPFTLNTAKANELVVLAEKAGVRNVIGLQRRLSPTNRYLHHLIKDGFVGKLRSVRMHVSMNYLQAMRDRSLRWTAPTDDFSHVIAIYAGHFLDALFAVIGKPTTFTTQLLNQFPVVTIKETAEVINTEAPDQLVMIGTVAENAVFTVHIEGGKRNNSGFQLDITGHEGDLKVTNVSSFGGVGEDYIIEGAHGDNILLEVMPVPAGYAWVEKEGMASSVLELGHLYAAFAKDVQTGSHTAPTFKDALWLHGIFDLMDESSLKGIRVTLAK